MAEIQSEKEKANMEEDIFDILHDVKVNVRRPDSTSVKNVNLGLNNLVRFLKVFVLILAEEYLNFLKNSYPDYETKLVSVPKSFQYGVKTHGITSEGKRLLTKYKEREHTEEEDAEQFYTWVKDTKGKLAEGKFFDKLTSMFCDEPCLLVSEFKESTLLKVVRENLQKMGKGSEMSQQVGTTLYIELKSTTIK